MSETSSAPQVWCVQVHVEPGTAGAGGPAAVSCVPRDDRFPLEPAWRRAGARAGEIDRALSGMSIAAWRQRALSSPLVGDRRRLVLSGSYLVGGEQAGDLPATARRLAARHTSLRVRVTGPWPPRTRSGIAQTRAGTRRPA